jgi:hypothetical protein
MPKSEGFDPASSPTASGDPETAALAIEFLQSQLEMATQAFDNLDRKAAFLPAFLAGAVGLLLGSANLTLWQGLLLVPALVTGAAAGWFAIQALKSRKLLAGPEPDKVIEKMGRPLSEFTTGLSNIVGQAVTARRAELSKKAAAFDKAMKLAAVTLLLVACARLIGGLTDGGSGNRRQADDHRGGHHGHHWRDGDQHGWWHRR